MLKQLLLALTAAVSAAPLGGAWAQSAAVQDPSPTVASIGGGPQPFAYVDGSITCPANAVYTVPFDRSAAKISWCRSDECFSNYIPQTFMPFLDVRNPIDGIRVFGIFLNSSYADCGDRTKLSDDKTKAGPIQLEATVWTYGSNGMAGELVDKVVVDVTGQKVATASHGEPIYSFDIPFSKTLRMVNGFVSVRAVGEERNLSCCFCLVTHTNVSPGGYISFIDKGETTFYSGSFVYCLTGDAEQSLAQRAVQLKRLLSPDVNERGHYAKTQVELTNFGDQPVSDATLTLLCDGKVVATEVVNRTLKSGETYKYTFDARVDLSTYADHTITVRNDTKGDELYAGQQLTATITNDGEPVASASTYYRFNYKFIKHVKVGDIDNESSGSYYSDYRGQYTTIKPGQTLPMTIDYQANNGDFVKVYVDWNGNGSFVDDGELVGYVSNGTLDLKIPEGIDAEPGDKVMRVMVCDKSYDAPPYGTYTFGETEDYTLTVEPADNGPQLKVSDKFVDLSEPASGTATAALTLSNKGNEDLTADVSVNYALSRSPESLAARRVAAAESPLRKPAIVAAPAKPDAPAPRPAAAAEEATTYSLAYGHGYSGDLGTADTYVDFAHYYPGEMLAPLAGMKVTSVDVYVAKKAQKSFITLRGQYDQQIAGDVIVKQQFTPKENSWNHVVLDNPVTLSNQDLWVCLSLEGAKTTGVLIGQDQRAAVSGFGDLISTNQSNYWWSLADLGYNHNVLIRANLSGTPTSAISWLQAAPKTLTLTPGSDQALDLTADTRNLANGFYEATVTLTTNDPARSRVEIPVYLRHGETTGITQATTTRDAGLSVTVADGWLRAHADAAVTGLTLYSPDGRLTLPATAGDAVSVAQLQPGVYVVKAQLADGRTESAVVSIK